MTKFAPMMLGALALMGCAQHRNAPTTYGNDMLPAARPYSGDALPSAEMIAFERTNARLGYKGARIEYDAGGCAVYEGTAPDGIVRREPLLNPSNQPICVRR